MIVIKSQAEIERMRVPNRMVAEFHQKMREIVKIGVTTQELNGIAEQYCRDNNAVPAFKGYGGSPTPYVHHRMIPLYMGLLMTPHCAKATS